MPIPILGQNPPPRVHPQRRLDAAERVAEVLVTTKDLGLRHGRYILLTPIGSTGLDYMLFLDALLDAGCTLVSTCEHPAEDGNSNPCLQVHLVFRLPAEAAQ